MTACPSKRIGDNPGIVYSASSETFEARMSDQRSKVAESNPSVHDLEIKDAEVIFKSAWQELENEFGHDQLRFPKAMILLGGAPGAGKGTHTPFIMQARGLTCEPIVVSSLLNTPEMQRIKDQGRMVGDREVVTLLLKKLVQPEYRDGALLDGFPRTHVQVECLKMLVEKINELHGEYKNTELALHFRRPVIHVMVLFVEERDSVERQLKRGREIAAHNAEVERTGIGEKKELRATDLDVEAARKRYQVFKEQTWEALQSLQEIYHYHFINAQGSIEEVERNILLELQYQSSLELDSKTFDLIRRIPVASEITRNARTELVNRLDAYVQKNQELFEQVLQIIEKRFMPIIIRHAITGHAVVNTEDPIFERPIALAILIDIFSERGFNAVVDKRVHEVVEGIDLQTGEINRRRKHVFRIQVHFPGSQIRRG